MNRYVRPRREEAVFVRVAIDGVVEEIGPDAAVVEECVALSRSSVADDLLPLATKIDEELEQGALRLLDVLREAPVARRRAQARLVFTFEQLAHCVARRMRPALVLDVHAQRAPVRLELLHVVDREAVRADDLRDRR